MAKPPLELEGLRRRARVATVLIGAVAALDVVRLFTVTGQVRACEAALCGTKGAVGDFFTYGQLAQKLALPSLAVFVVSGIAYLRWLHLASGNAARLGSREPLQFGPRDAVMAFFIPVFNLVLPHRALEEIRRASDPSDFTEPHRLVDAANPAYRDPALVPAAPPPWRPRRVPVTAWWTLYIGSSIGQVVASLLGGLATPLCSPGVDFERAAGAGRISVISIVAKLASAALCALVIGGITRNQVERARRRRAQREAERERSEAELDVD